MSHSVLYLDFDRTSGISTSHFLEASAATELRQCRADVRGHGVAEKSEDGEQSRLAGSVCANQDSEAGNVAHLHVFESAEIPDSNLLYLHWWLPNSSERQRSCSRPVTVTVVRAIEPVSAFPDADPDAVPGRRRMECGAYCTAGRSINTGGPHHPLKKRLP